MDAFVAGIEIDPGVPEFIRLCTSLGHRVSVVSDGLDRTVGAVLRRHGIDVPHFANHLEHVGERRWRLTFPWARDDCKPLSGNCKCQFATSTTRGLRDIRVVVGDGRSDFCVAEGADLVLAKSSLTRHCVANDLPHFAFTTFAEATDLFARWLDQRVVANGRPFEQ